MKFRTDFVTNSSSSSFLIARKPSEKQKKAILQFVEDNFLGTKGEDVLTPDSSEEEIKEFLDYNGLEDKSAEIRKFLRKGLTVTVGYIDNDADIFMYLGDLWKTLKKSDPGNFYSEDLGSDG